MKEQCLLCMSMIQKRIQATVSPSSAALHVLKGYSSQFSLGRVKREDCYVSSPL
jgi:hypothetical protein